MSSAEQMQEILDARGHESMRALSGHHLRGILGISTTTIISWPLPIPISTSSSNSFWNKNCSSITSSSWSLKPAGAHHRGFNGQLLCRRHASFLKLAVVENNSYSRLRQKWFQTLELKSTLNNQCLWGRQISFYVFHFYHLLGEQGSDTAKVFAGFLTYL